jgi:hypothetical protein
LEPREAHGGEGLWFSVNVSKYTHSLMAALRQSRSTGEIQSSGLPAAKMLGIPRFVVQKHGKKPRLKLGAAGQVPPTGGWGIRLHQSAKVI